MDYVPKLFQFFGKHPHSHVIVNLKQQGGIQEK